MVEVFKTNVKYKKHAKMLSCCLSERFPLFQINFDLEDCDKILRVEGENISIDKITGLIAKNGYQCELLT